MKANIKLVVIYGLAMAGGALVLDGLEVQFFLNSCSTEVYVFVLDLMTL